MVIIESQNLFIEITWLFSTRIKLILSKVLFDTLKVGKNARKASLTLSETPDEVISESLILFSRLMFGIVF